MTSTSLTNRSVKLLANPVRVLGGSLAVCWATLGANAVAHGSLIQYGIIPRTMIGLRGILFAPFIHGSVDHLVANSVPFLILGGLVLLQNGRKFFGVTAAAALGSGLMAWTIGAPGSVHVGASGVIFGYLGYLMLTGWFTRRFWSILLSVVVTAVWGGLVFGVLPNQPGVSWQGHLGGFIGGILAARAFRRP